MAPQTPTRFPDSFRIGDTVKWKSSFSDHPAGDSWELETFITNASNKYGPYSGTADGDDFVTTIGSDVTATFAAGDYSYQIRAKLTAPEPDEVYTVEIGTVEIKPVLSSAVDSRSHAKKVLDAIEAVLENRASKDQQSYSIEGRSLARTPIERLIELRTTYRNLYQGELDDEAARKGRSRKGVAFVQFRRPT